MNAFAYMAKCLLTSGGRWHHLPGGGLALSLQAMIIIEKVKDMSTVSEI